MLRHLLIALASLAAFDAQAVVVDSVWREVRYAGGLEQPDMMGDVVTSTSMGLLDESFSDAISSPGYGDAGADASQTSVVDLSYGTLSIDLTGDASNFATSLADGAISDSLSWTEVEVVFTATENVLISADLFVSSDLAVFYDGPGAGVVETSHLGSILICIVGGGCVVDVLVDDVTDNGLGVSDGVLDSAWFPPGQYSIELVAVSQTISRDVGSAAGSSGFSGTVTVEPAPEPGAAGALAAGGVLLAGLARRRAARRSRGEQVGSPRQATP